MDGLQARELRSATVGFNCVEHVTACLGLVLVADRVLNRTGCHIVVLVLDHDLAVVLQLGRLLRLLKLHELLHLFLWLGCSVPLLHVHLVYDGCIILALTTRLFLVVRDRGLVTDCL